jgi:uncharacterized membrane protein
VPRPRALLVTAGAAGLVGGIVAGTVSSWRYTPLIGWDVAALTYLGVLWLAIGRLDSGRTATAATREDPGRAATDVIVLLGAIASLSAVGVILVQSGSASGNTQDLVAGFGLLSVALSWFVVHTSFTVRYARLYYGDPVGGIDFNQQERPRYLDFAYLAFTLGMTFQVSDTDLQTTQIRATALRHALLSYLFGAVILATAINLVAGLASSHGG